MKHFFIYLCALIIIVALAIINFCLITNYKSSQMIKNLDFSKQHNPAAIPSDICGLSDNSCQAGTTTQKTEPTADNVAAEIEINSPSSNQLISSPLKISGQAFGAWYFEGVFPIQLIGSNGQVLARGQASAQTDWTNAEFVPFKAELSFNAGSSTIGMLVFSNDNPSGLPQNEKQFGIPVRFGK
jgi:hypothetical protein